MAWIPQNFVLANGILDSLFRNVNRANGILAVYAGQPAAYIDFTLPGGAQKYFQINANLSSSSVSGIRPWIGTANVNNGVASSPAATNTAKTSTQYGGAGGTINMTFGLSGSGADVIVDSLTAPTVVTNFSLRAPSGAGGTVLSTTTRNKIADALVTSGASGFSGSYALKLFSGTPPATAPDADAVGNSSNLPNFLGVIGYGTGANCVKFASAVSGVSQSTDGNAGVISGLPPNYAMAASGTATWALLVDSTGAVVLACTCGDTGTEVAVLNNAIITAGSTTPRINAFSYSYP